MRTHLKKVGVWCNAAGVMHKIHMLKTLPHHTACAQPYILFCVSSCASFGTLFCGMALTNLCLHAFRSSDKYNLNFRHELTGVHTFIVRLSDVYTSQIILHIITVFGSHGSSTLALLVLNHYTADVIPCCNPSSIVIPVAITASRHAQGRRSPTVILHSRVQGSSKSVHRQFQGETQITHRNTITPMCLCCLCCYEDILIVTDGV